MSIGRVLSSVAASAAVAGCAVVAFGMANAQVPRSDQSDRAARPVAATHTARPAALGTSGAATSAVPATADPTPAASTSADPTTGNQPATQVPSATPPAVRQTADARAATTAPVSSAPAMVTSARAAQSTPTHAIVHAAAPRTVAPVAKPQHVSAPEPAVAAPKAATSTQRRRGSSLPLHFKTYYSTRVLTVRAYSHSSTTAVLQAWSKAPGGGWLRHGDSVTAHVGAAGIGSASEYTSKTPAGAFTLTQAFGHYSDPGTGLPYLHTNSSDWWISQPGRLYNTHQRCSSNCGFNQGNPNEHLFYETPYYNYAMVIDYNTRNAPGGVHAGKGSAFFLHVTDGAPTAGCVAIPQDKLVSIMRWLSPSAHPRILIGVT